MSFIWIEPTPLPADAPRLHDDPLLNRILHGVVGTEADAAAFLDPTFRPAPDPFAVPNMHEAVARVGAAIGAGEPIAVFGDYDADGVTSTAILLLALEQATGKRPRAWLPDREQGYGLNAEAIHEIAASGASLLIAVDCGSGDDEHIALARSLGLDVVVIDHHQMHGAPPEGAIVVSPRVRSGAPYGELAAAGLVYLFAVALSKSGFDLGRGVGREPVGLLDLAAIGLVGDSSPMVGATRALVRNGIRCLREGRRPGVRALMNAAKIEPPRLRSHDIAMRLAPRVNAPGRMAKPDLALELLLAPDDGTAFRLMRDVEAHNQTRRAETEAMLAEAIGQIEAGVGPAARQVLVVTGDAWRHGVVGLVAGQLARRYDRPVLMLAEVGDELRGSARSVDGFDITAALHEAGRLLRRFGGHRQAAGLQLASADLAKLTERLEASARAAGLAEPRPNAIRIAADLPIERFDLPTARLLELLEPFGDGFAEPVLRLRQAHVRFADRIGADRRHLRLKVETPTGLADVLCWSAAERAAECLPGSRVDVVGRITVNEWGGRRSAQMVAEDFRPSADAASSGRTDTHPASMLAAQVR